MPYKEKEIMASVMEVITCLNQIAANSYDDGVLEGVGLNREEGHPIMDSRLIDGFRVRFAADQMIVSYQAEMHLNEVHPRNQFENEIERKFADIVKFLKKEYKVIKKQPVTLTSEADAQMIVQTTSRYHTWIQANKIYRIGGLAESTDGVKKSSENSAASPFEKRFKDFLELSTDKRPPNDTSKKNPDTPEA